MNRCHYELEEHTSGIEREMHTHKCSTVKEGDPFLSITSPFLSYGGKHRDYSGRSRNTLGNYVITLLCHEKHLFVSFQWKLDFKNSTIQQDQQLIQLVNE